MKITIEFKSGKVRSYPNAIPDTNIRAVLAYSDDHKTVTIIPFEAVELFCMESEEEE